jgi:quercetin dioxygenase-like cupin family protein
MRTTKRVVASLMMAGLLLAPQAAAQELPPGPEAIYRSAFDVTDPATEFQVITLVLEFAPGAWTPMHTHGGLGRVTVIEGTVTRRSLAGEEHSYGPGDGWLEDGEVEAAGNDTQEVARVIFTLMLPEGAEVTIAHEE